MGRKLVIDVHPDVFPLLLKEGYSRTFGARPLKRTIERMILLPLARKLASGRVPAESLIRLSAGVKQIHVDIEPRGLFHCRLNRSNHRPSVCFQICRNEY